MLLQAVLGSRALQLQKRPHLQRFKHGGEHEVPASQPSTAHTIGSHDGLAQQAQNP